MIFPPSPSQTVNLSLYSVSPDHLRKGVVEQRRRAPGTGPGPSHTDTEPLLAWKGREQPASGGGGDWTEDKKGASPQKRRDLRGLSWRRLVRR